MLGNSFPARVASSLLNAINLPELVTLNSHDYELLAVELGKNRGKIQAIKNKLLSNIETAPLFNTKLSTRNLESLLLKMHERHVNQSSADHIF
jgi:predicted O-linked N-acetylglucosamine transferase (SPINDLY family)